MDARRGTASTRVTAAVVRTENTEEFEVTIKFCVNMVYRKAAGRSGCVRMWSGGTHSLIGQGYYKISCAITSYT